MDDILKDMEEYKGIIDHILEILPSDHLMALAILSMCIDSYAARFNMRSMEYWKMVYEVAKDVHNICGEYTED